MYTLIDGIQRNKENPKTFHIPTASEIDKLTAGDFVKLGFKMRNGDSEKMWVEINKRYAGRFQGTLANDPVLIQSLSFDDLISFERKHILAIYSEG